MKWVVALAAVLALAVASSRLPAVPAGIDTAKLQTVQAQVDFPVAVPRYLPLGLKLVGAWAFAHPPELPGSGTEAHFSFFAYPDGPGLQFSQSSRKPGQVQVQPAEAMTPTYVQDTWGQLYQDPNREGRTYLALLWQNNGITFELWGFLNHGLTREMFLKIAESVE